MDNSPRFCAKCGNPLNVGGRFCGKCGFDNETKPQKKSRKKLWIGLGIGGVSLLALVCVLVVLLLNMGGKDRAIMIYMIGSDLESEGAAASLDITEMKDASFDPEHTKLLVYTGGSKKWALDDIDENENAIFEVTNGAITKVQSFEKKLMTEPGSLTEFVDYVYENYPADLYDLVLWDHGGGPIVGYGQDENSLMGKSMKIPALTGALTESKLVKDGKRFDLIGFDACLMGSAEVARQLSGYANYMVASEETEPGDGWSYSFLNNLSEEKMVNDTEELGRVIIDEYISHYNDYQYDVDLSLALIDLKKIQQLSDSVDALFSKVKEQMTEQTFSQYSQLMTREKVYGYTGRDNQSYDLVDLLDLCNSLQENYGDEVNEIRSDFDDVVLYNQNNMENTNGMSVYFLNFNKAEAEKMLVNYKDVAFSEKYYDFLSKYKDYVTGDRRVSRALYTDLKEEITENGIAIELPNELRDNYQSGEIIIYRKLGDNKYMPVYRSSEVKLDGDRLVTTTYNLQFVIEVNNGSGIQYGWSMMAEKERTENYADYVTFGVLYYNDDSALGFAPKSYEMYVRVPSGSNEGQVRDIRVASDTDMASKMSFDPSKIKIIDFTVGTYKLFNGNNELDYNMESYGQIYGTEANVENGDTYKIKLVGLDFDFGDIYEGEFKSLDDYYAEFIVHDTQGDSHRLNLIHID